MYNDYPIVLYRRLRKSKVQLQAGEWWIAMRRQPVLYISMIIFAALIIAIPVMACDTPPPTPAPIQKFSLSLIPKEATNQLPMMTSKTITAIIVDNHGQAVPGIQVSFTSTFGSFDGGISVVTTGSNGQASVGISSVFPGMATITATAGDASATSIVTWKGNPEPRIPSIQIIPEDSTLQLPIMPSKTLTVIVADQHGQPMPNVLVTATTNFGTFPDSTQLTSVTSQSNGQSQITVASSDAGVATLTAWVDTNQNSVPDTGEPSDLSTVTWLAPQVSPPPKPFTCPVTSQSLVTADGQTVGCVAVSNDDVNLYVSVTTVPDPVTKVDWAWGLLPDDIPHADGSPDFEAFPYSHTFAACELSYAFPGVDISNVLSSDVAYLIVSAHASTQSGKDAWVESVDGSGARVKYFIYPIP
jgi:Bacterial Ig-like domain (group 1)